MMQEAQLRNLTLFVSYFVLLENIIIGQESCSNHPGVNEVRIKFEHAHLIVEELERIWVFASWVAIYPEDVDCYDHVMNIGAKEVNVEDSLLFCFELLKSCLH